MIENVNRRPASAMTGETMFGRISRRRIASVPLAPRLGRLDVAAHRLLERRGADDPGDQRHLHDRDRRHEDRRAGTGAGDEHEDEEQRREREQDVGAAHQQRRRASARA